MYGSWACPGWPVAEHHERGGSVHLVEASTVLMGFGAQTVTKLDEPTALRVYPRKDGNRPCAPGGLPRARRGCAD